MLLCQPVTRAYRLCRLHSVSLVSISQSRHRVLLTCSAPPASSRAAVHSNSTVNFPQERDEEEHPTSLPGLVSALSAVSRQQLDAGLHLVSTPIGNREDITLRALRVLQQVSIIYAEDTRHSRQLLDYYGISTPLVSLHEHNEHSRMEQVLQQLACGASIALISDAGTPMISDPGSQLVATAAAAGHRIIPLPGPSAAVAAVVASALPSGDFRFIGFLPPKTAARRKSLEAIKGGSATLVCYVPPHGLPAVLRDAADILGHHRRCTVAREMTKARHRQHRASSVTCLPIRMSAHVLVTGEVTKARCSGNPGPIC